MTWLSERKDAIVDRRRGDRRTPPPRPKATFDLETAALLLKLEAVRSNIAASAESMSQASDDMTEAFALLHEALQQHDEGSDRPA